METLVHPGVHRRHHVRDARHAGGEAAPYLLLALLAMGDERAHVGLRIDDGRPVGWPVHGFVARQELVQTRHVAGHVAVRRRDDAGGPTHDVIAGEQRALLRQREAKVVGGVAGRVHALERPPIAPHHVAVAHLHRRFEIHVAALFHRYASFDLPGAVAPVAVGRRRGVVCKGAAARRVVVVGVRYQHVGDGLPGGGANERVDVGGVGRAGIDDGDVAAPDDVGAGAVERERARISGHHAPDQRRQLRHRAVLELQLAPEGDVNHWVPLGNVPNVAAEYTQRQPVGCLPRLPDHCVSVC